MLIITIISHLKPGILNRCLFAFACTTVTTVACLDVESRSKGSHWMGIRILHPCSNPSGKVPTIILVPRTHTHTLKKHPGNHFHIYFLCVDIPQPFICFNKKQYWTSQSGLSKCFLKMLFERTHSKCAGHLCHVKNETSARCQKASVRLWTPPIWSECGFTPVKGLFWFIGCVWLNILDPISANCTQSISCHRSPPGCKTSFYAERPLHRAPSSN